MKYYHIIVIAMVIILSMSIAPFAKAQYITEKTYDWKLTGNEILAELADANKFEERGIYAIDPNLEKPEPKLLIKGAYKPEWRPDHKFFIYYDDEYLWMADKNGKAIIAYAKTFPMAYLDPLDPPAKWLSSNELIYRFKFNSVGTVFLLADNKPIYKSLNEWKYKGANGTVQLWEGTVNDVKGGLDGIKIGRNIDMSPDGKHAVIQIAPLAPMDLKNIESKLFVCDITFDQDEAVKDYFISSFYFTKQRPKRLTNLGDDVCEIDPIWSPDGKWIAFTVIHFNNGYMAPAVCRPDGSEYMELMPENCSQYNASIWFGGKDWFPAAEWDGKIKKQDYYSTNRMWGNPHASAVKWSEDGKYLLINTGDRYRNLVLAKYEENKWIMNVVAMTSGGPESGAGIQYFALGKNDTGNPSLAYPLMLWIYVFDLTKLGSESNPKMIVISDDKHNFLVKWLSW